MFKSSTLFAAATIVGLLSVVLFATMKSGMYGACALAAAIVFGVFGCFSLEAETEEQNVQW